MAPAYSGLPNDKKQYALTACKYGIPESGKRLANCLLCGAVFAHTRFNRKLALAHKFPCGELCCANCNRAEYRLRSWMRQRDAERIYSSKHVGIELSIPGDEGYLQSCDQLLYLAKKLTKWLGITDYVATCTAPEGWVTIRLALRCDGLKDCPAIRAKWQKLTEEYSGGEIAFRHPEGVTGRAARQIFLWAFQGMECLSSWPTEDQVGYRMQTRGEHLIHSFGTHYRKLTDEEQEERRQREQDKLIESMERKGWQMVYIPFHERIVEPCDDIEDSWERVEYKIEFDEMIVYSHTNIVEPARAAP